MPKRTDLKKIMVIGSGPIVIGQACEFDYSGTQGIKALKEEGYEVVLVNSNPATIMTDPGLADRTYIEPIEPETVAAIVRKERPCAILPTLGGQTGLNTALALAKSGVLAECGTELIGARAEVIEGPSERHRPQYGRRAPHRFLHALPDDHPPRLHARRHGRRHRLQYGRP